MFFSTLFVAIAWLPFPVRAVITLAAAIGIIYIVVKIIILIKELIFNWL